MRLDYALKLAHQLERFEDERCRKPKRSGYYVRQVLFPLATRAEQDRAEAEANDENLRRTRVIWVKLDDLKAPQGCLGRPRLIYQLHRHPLKRLPTVIRLGRGKYLLWDGNHRATAAAMLGRVRIKCTELRKAA